VRDPPPPPLDGPWFPIPRIDAIGGAGGVPLHGGGGRSSVHSSCSTPVVLEEAGVDNKGNSSPCVLQDGFEDAPLVLRVECKERV
jgi:hypothetical protein